MGSDASRWASIDRAAALLQRPARESDFVVLKLLPARAGCCCFHCWPTTWSAINEFIAPNGPIPDEGDALIHTAEGDYVLECHESGPEIVVYLGVTTASLVLIKSVVDLVTVFLKNLTAGDRGSSSRMKLSHRRFYGGQIADDILVEIDLPLAEDTAEILNTKIKEALQRGTEPGNAADGVLSPASRPSAHYG